MSSPFGNKLIRFSEETTFCSSGYFFATFLQQNTSCHDLLSLQRGHFLEFSHRTHNFAFSQAKKTTTNIKKPIKKIILKLLKQLQMKLNIQLQKHSEPKRLN